MLDALRVRLAGITISPNKRDRLVGLWLFLPMVIFVSVLSFYPLVRVILMSFYQQHLLSLESTFVGFGNFRAVFGHHRFWPVVRNTMVFTFGSLILQMAVGLIVAILLNAKFPFRRMARGFLLFSYLLPYVVAALTWRFLFSSTAGVFHYALSQSSLGVPPSVFGSPSWAMRAVLAVNTWKYFPFFVITFLAQMQSVDTELYEAAEVDGATRIQRFRFITFPALVPVIFMAGMLRTIYNFNNFTAVYLLTRGGPIGRTETMPLQIYNLVFGQLSTGRGAALAVLGFMFIIAVSVFFWRMYERAVANFQ